VVFILPLACGYYESEDAAFDSMIGEELGAFMVKRCKEPGTDIEVNSYEDKY